MGRIVLNDPAPATGRAGADVAETLGARMLAAAAAAMDTEGRLARSRLARSEEFAAATAAARALGQADPTALGDRATRLAFWINVYNALVFHGIVRLDVRRSVLRTWNFFGRVAYRVGPFVLSADEIEHGVLRDNARRPLPPLRPFARRDPRRALAVSPVDPRVHFALTCGARSCPPVGVYRADRLDAQLDLAAESFVNEAVTLEDGRIVCSKIFRWYRRDFEAAGGLGPFLLRYLEPGPARDALAAGAPPCRAWRPYSWALRHELVE